MGEVGVRALKQNASSVVARPRQASRYDHGATPILAEFDAASRGARHLDAVTQYLIGPPFHLPCGDVRRLVPFIENQLVLIWGEPRYCATDDWPQASG
jgi:hypothetical protein